jgi:hypothetical protein
MSASTSTVALYLLAETDKAIMVGLKPGQPIHREPRIWLPKSKVVEEGRSREQRANPVEIGAEMITITAPDWMLRDRGLI